MFINATKEQIRAFIHETSIETIEEREKEAQEREKLQKEECSGEETKSFEDQEIDPS